MVLDLKGGKVVVTGGKQFVERAVAAAVAPEGADVLTPLRKCNDEVKRGRALRITQLKVPSQQSHGTRSTSLWRQTIVEKSYW
jgi:NAD(P)-dependent dehydrogenase (short-subunit alcohol dehydrogenase family)